MSYCIIKTIIYKLTINLVFHVSGWHKNQVLGNFKILSKVIHNPAKSYHGDEKICNFFKSWEVITILEDGYAITFKILENNFLANVHSISVIDSGEHLSQFSDLPENQNLCELRDAASSQNNQDESLKSEITICISYF